MKTSTKISILNSVFLLGLVLLEHTHTVSFTLWLSYGWHKVLHIFGVALFMSNMIIGPVWFMFAVLSKNKDILRFADRLLRITDVSFTIFGLNFAVINGLFLASAFGGSSELNWLTYSVYLLIAMTLFSYPLLYIQEKVYQVIEREPENETSLKKWIYRWSVVGTLFMIFPSVIFYLMIVKNIN